MESRWKYVHVHGVTTESRRYARVSHAYNGTEELGCSF